VAELSSEKHKDHSSGYCAGIAALKPITCFPLRPAAGIAAGNQIIFQK